MAPWAVRMDLKKISMVCLHNNAIVARGILVTILHCGTPELRLSAIYIVRPPQTRNFYRKRREIFVSRDENEKSSMFDIYNNGQEIFISCDKNRSCAVFGYLFLKQGISYRKISCDKNCSCAHVCNILARDKNLSSLAIKIARVRMHAISRKR